MGLTITWVGKSPHLGTLRNSIKPLLKCMSAQWSLSFNVHIIPWEYSGLQWVVPLATGHSPPFQVPNSTLCVSFEFFWERSQGWGTEESPGLDPSMLHWLYCSWIPRFISLLPQFPCITKKLGNRKWQKKMGLYGCLIFYRKLYSTGQNIRKFVWDRLMFPVGQGTWDPGSRHCFHSLLQKQFCIGI